MRTVKIVASVVLIVAGAGCPNHIEHAAPDAPPDDPLESFTAITVDTGQPPALVAFRDGATAAWQTVTGTSMFVFVVHGPYVAAVVCDDGQGDVTISEFARTPDDGIEISSPCAAPAGAELHVKGTMVQAGTIALGSDQGSSATPNWNFDLADPSGTYDLIALTTDRIAMLRSLPLTGTTMVTPAIDLTTVGSPLVAAPLTVPNALPAETVTAQVFIDTSSTQLSGLFKGAVTDVVVAPSAVLIAGDDQDVMVSAVAGNNRRTVHKNFRVGNPTVFAVPGALGPVQFSTTNNTITATWSTLPDYDVIDAVFDGVATGAAGFSSRDFEISKRFVDTTGGTSLTFDLDLPGFKPAWKADLTMQYTRAVEAIKYAGGDSALSSVIETLNVSSPRRPVRDRAADAIERRALARNPRP